MLPHFTNEPYYDFSRQADRKVMQAAIEEVAQQLGKDYPIIIGGEKIVTKDKIESINPCQKEQIVGRFSKGTRELAVKAIETAAAKFEEWRFWPADHRARILLRAAHIMRRRKAELAAWQVYETSKSWAEAVADVAEAIDFQEFYAREALRLAQPKELTPYPGEEQDLQYIPLGVGAVIPPWNFPLAIMSGMTGAAVVTGNTVVLKPASTAPMNAWLYFDILKEAGLPDGVVNYLPGPGAAMGDTIVDHPKTRFIAFTGSMEVGMRIYERASVVQEGQIWLKRTILEMGGKDCIVVDNDADLDSAAEGVVASAFGFQGQKCSACSRLIVHQDVYQDVLSRVVERTKKLTIGPVESVDNDLGAVIDKNAYEKILGYIQIGKKEGQMMCGGHAGPETGYFIEPTVIADVKPNARMAQEEIFGPVLSVIKARDFDEAIDIANGTIYGLTGAVFSRNREHLEKARRKFHVGNLYFNRKCTGALVDVQPFGGFNMSGTDSKAGGRDYLLLFTQAKTITERF